MTKHEKQTLKVRPQECNNIQEAYLTPKITRTTQV